MSEDEVRPTSILFNHCESVFDEMTKQARDEGDDGLVYEGLLTKLVTAELGLATPRYTAVMGLLKRMGCVEQLRRGGGGTPSRWRLLRAPDEESFNSIDGMKRASSSKHAIVEQQVRDLNKRLLAVEAALGNAQQVIKSLNKDWSESQQRIQELETKVHDLVQLSQVVSTP